MQLAAPPQVDNAAFEAAIKRLYDFGGYLPGLLTDEAIKPLMAAINASLQQSIQKGIRIEVPEELISKLRNDVFVFSGCKTAAQLREAGGMLLDTEGKVRTWEVFKTEMQAVYKRYNEQYLEAEYNFATQSATMAARWAADSQNGDRYNLQYRTAGDERVRESHQALNLTTLPPSDPFWESYYPPNGWRCRCTAVQVLKDKYEASDSAESITAGEKATTVIDKDGRNRMAMFRFNPGKQGVIFPPHHPYYKFKGDLPDDQSEV